MAAVTENTIEAKGLVQQYKKGPRAVDGVDLFVSSGEIFGFLALARERRLTWADPH